MYATHSGPQPTLRDVTRRSALLAPFLLAAACLRPAPAPAPTVAPAGYAVRVSYPLSRERDGMRGRIELLEDARLRPEMREPIREAYGMDPCADAPADGPLHPLCAAPTREPLRPAVVRVVDQSGREVASRRFERPLGDLTVAELHGDARPTYLATVDMSAGMGSYSGPLTELAEVRDGRLEWLAADTGAGRAAEIHLSLTLKTSWRLVPRDDGRGQDVIQIACRPDFDAPGTSNRAAFVVTYERFSYEGDRWVRHARRESGFWEDEFPDRSRFP